MNNIYVKEKQNSKAAVTCGIKEDNTPPVSSGRDVPVMHVHPLFVNLLFRQRNVTKKTGT